MAGKYPIPPLANALRNLLEHGDDDWPVETLFSTLTESGAYAAYPHRPHDDRSFKKELASRAEFFHAHYGIVVRIEGDNVWLRKVKR